jgi:hypothetical protein
VITLLNVGSPTAVARLRPGELIKKMQEQVAVRQKYRVQQVNMFMAKGLIENRDAENAIKKHLSENNLVRVKVIENIRNQETAELELRAEERRKRSGSLNRTFTVNSGGRTDRINKYQEEIEQAIEKCSEEREERVRGVKKKYKDEIKELRGLGGDGEIIGRVIEEMKVALKKEITEI